MSHNCLKRSAAFIIAASFDSSHAAAFESRATTSCGTYQGHPVPSEPSVLAFRGIRFSLPPVGRLRWMPAEEPECNSSAFIVADKNGQVCSQANRINGTLHVSRLDLVVQIGSLVCFFLASLSLCVLRTPLSRLSRPSDSFTGTEIEMTPIGLVADDESPEHQSTSLAMEKDPPWENASPSSGRFSRFCTKLCAGTCFAVLVLVASVFGLCFSLTKSDLLQPMIGGEDCLFLNVYAPASAIGNRSVALPVLVFVHGGDLTHLSGTDSGPQNSGGSWALPATGRAVAVQINYRLGVFGFLHLEDHVGSPVFPNSTNLGLLDILAACRWVQAHVSAFGGDPHRVTIYGQSSGGTAVLSLLASPMATGLFQRAYAMSASPKIDATPRKAAAQWRQMYLPDVHECRKQGDAIFLAYCLRSLSADQLIRATLFSTTLDPSWIWDLPTTKVPGPVIELVVADGHTVLGNVSEVFAESSALLPHVPTIIGTMREEVDGDFTRNAAWPFNREAVLRWALDMCDCPSLGPETWRLYEPSAETPERQRWSQLATDFRFTCGNLHCARQLARGQDAPVYSYVFTHHAAQRISNAPVPFWPGGGEYAFHSWDLALLLNHSGGFTAEDFTVADRFRNHILEFAENGFISSWTPVSADRPAVCEIGAETVCAGDPRQEQCQLFESCEVSYSNWLVN